MVSAAVDAPGKFAGDEHRLGRIALLDAETQLGDDLLIFDPRLEVRRTTPPKLRLCEPFCQLRVFSNDWLNASRADGVPELLAGVMNVGLLTFR